MSSIYGINDNIIIPQIRRDNLGIIFYIFFLNKNISCDLSSDLQVPEKKIAKFANSIVIDEVAHNEPPHLDLHCLPSSL